MTKKCIKILLTQVPSYFENNYTTIPFVMGCKSIIISPLNYILNIGIIYIDVSTPLFFNLTTAIITLHLDWSVGYIKLHIMYEAFIQMANVVAVQPATYSNSCVYLAR